MIPGAVGRAPTPPKTRFGLDINFFCGSTHGAITLLRATVARSQELVRLTTVACNTLQPPRATPNSLEALHTKGHNHHNNNKMEDDSDSSEEPPANALNALLKMQLKNARVAQLTRAPGLDVRALNYPPRLAFAAVPFDAMLAGVCGVLSWSAPLARMMSPDARRVVDSFLRPRITERAATVLRIAAENFAKEILCAAQQVAINNRSSACVWSRDVEDAIQLLGADRVTGTCRPQTTACACTALCGRVAPQTLATPLYVDAAVDSPEACAAPTVAWRRRPTLWCEAAPLDGSTPQSAIYRSMRFVACRAGAPHLAPGALNAACSAVVAFISTVVAKAHGKSTPLLQAAAESDARLVRLRDVVHASCAAALSDSESDADSEFDESIQENSGNKPRDFSDGEPWDGDDSDGDDSLNRFLQSGALDNGVQFAWEHTLRTRFIEPRGHDGLTEHVVLRALEDLDYKLFSILPDARSMGGEFHKRYGRDILGMLRTGTLDLDQFFERGADEDNAIDDESFAYRLRREQTVRDQFDDYSSDEDERAAGADDLD